MGARPAYGPTPEAHAAAAERSTAAACAGGKTCGTRQELQCRAGDDFEARGMNDQEIYDSFQPLWGDFGDYQWMLDNRPLLAHYTSMQTLEQIMKNEEIWFSNPLFMNDLEEMRFGMNMGARLFEQN
jgi:hypothetical protein